MSFKKVLANVGQLILIVVWEVSWLQNNYSLASHEVLYHDLVTLGEDWEVFVVFNKSLGAKLNGEYVLSPESEDELVWGKICLKL